MAATVAARSLGDPPVETGIGTLGYQPPEVTDVRLPDTMLHQDTTGGVIQQLLGATGTRGAGFGLVWRDQRDGTLGIYVARLDSAGNLREPERSVSSVPSTSRRYDPSIALSPEGGGAVTWVARHTSGQRPRLRCFDPAGEWYGTDLLVPALSGPAEARGATPRDSGARTPVVLARRDNSRTLVWIENGRIRVSDFDVAGGPLRPTTELGPAGTDPEPGLYAVEDALGGLAVQWNGKSGVWVARRPVAGVQPSDTQLGEGIARGIVADPDGGTWTLVQRGDVAVLRRFTVEGKPQGPEITRTFPELRNLGLESVGGGLAVLATLGGAPAPARGEAEGGRIVGPAREPAGIEPQRRGQREIPAAKNAAGARIELVLVPAGDTKFDGEAIAITSAEARDVERAFVASDGVNVLVAWNDARLGDSDVYGRVVDTKKSGAERLGEEKRINTDFASSDQIYPDVDAVGEFGWTLWQDRRAKSGVMYVRRFDANGLVGDEIPLPVAFGDTAATAPENASDGAVTMRPDGSMLATWTQREEKRARIFGQALARDGKALAAPIEIDSRPPPSLERAATTALGGERGWYAVWPAGGKNGVFGRRIAPDGTLAGPARRISEPSDDALMHVDVTMLGDGRLIAAWTVHAAGASQEDGWTVRARFLDPEGAPKGGEIRFEASRRRFDHDPVLAAADQGGFMMAWCSGLPGDPTHDVNVRLFDAQGKPAGPNLTPCYFANEQDYPDIARLADGSYAVVWEDDISFFDQSYVRRISADGKSMGPLMRIGTLETKLVPDRVVPRIAAFGTGWAAVFADRRRSLGFDARLKVVGPAFDAPTGD